MYLLRMQLEAERSDHVHPSQGFLDAVFPMMRTALESAIESVRILSMLQKHDMLGKVLSVSPPPICLRTTAETFLPFDLEAAFSSTFVMILIRGLNHFPAAVEDASVDEAQSIFDAMSQQGYRPAAIRALDLERLKEMLAILSQCRLRRRHTPQAQAVTAEGLYPAQTDASASATMNPTSTHSVDLSGHSNSNTEFNDIERNTQHLGWSLGEMLSQSQTFDWDNVFAGTDNVFTGDFVSEQMEDLFSVMPRNY